MPTNRLARIGFLRAGQRVLRVLPVPGRLALRVGGIDRASAGAAIDHVSGHSPPSRTPGWERTRTAAQVLDEARRVVEPAHRAAIDALPAQIAHVAGYHAGWRDPDGAPCRGGGKAVRPALTLACGRAAATAAAVAAAQPPCRGADTLTGFPARARTAVVDAAVAVELVHDFSLLHDDVMDGDLTRRHRPTAWAVFGVSQAILTGDALLALAVDVLARSAPDAMSVKVLAGALGELCKGQAADLAFENHTEVSVAGCMDMAEAKTGALLGAACELGALAAGAPAVRAAQYRLFGRRLGLAFQLIDDLLGIWGDPAVTGKPAGSDLVSRKKSLPVVAALASNTPAGHKLADLYQGEKDLDGQTIAYAAGLIEAAGGRAWAQAEAERQCQAAQASLAQAAPAPAASAELQLLADLITRRSN